MSVAWQMRMLSPRVLGLGSMTLWIDDAARRRLPSAIADLGRRGGGGLYVASIATLANSRDDLRKIIELAHQKSVTIYLAYDRTKLEPSVASYEAAGKLLEESIRAAGDKADLRAKSNAGNIQSAAAVKTMATAEKLAIARELWGDLSVKFSEIERRSGLSLTTLYKRLGKRKSRPDQAASSGFESLPPD